MELVTTQIGDKNGVLSPGCRVLANITAGGQGLVSGRATGRRRSQNTKSGI